MFHVDFLKIKQFILEAGNIKPAVNELTLFYRKNSESIFTDS